MRAIKFAILVLLFVTLDRAAAQQPQSMSPSQAAIIIGQNVNSLALSLEQQQKINADLEKQIADLKAKCGKPCADSK